MNRYMGITKKEIAEAFEDFKGIEHRLEPVKRIFGVEFVNDARSVSQNAFWFSMMEIKSPIIWITYLDAPIADKQKFAEIRKQVRHIVFIGANSKHVHKDFATEVDSITTVGDISEAVKMATHYSRRGDIVIFSPAAQIDNYKLAGKQFKNAVSELEK